MAIPSQAQLDQTTAEKASGVTNVAVHQAIMLSHALFGRQVANGSFRQDEFTYEHVVKR